jgi:hypothetical protein
MGGVDLANQYEARKTLNPANQSPDWHSECEEATLKAAPVGLTKGYP